MSQSEPRSVFVALVAKASGIALSPCIGSDELMQAIRGLTAVQMAALANDVAGSGIIPNRRASIDFPVADGDLEDDEWSPVQTYLEIKKPINDPELDALQMQPRSHSSP